MDRWIREAIHIKKEQDNSMNRDEGSYRHLVDSRSKKATLVEKFSKHNKITVVF